MQNIEEISLQTYGENLLYFQNSHPIIFEKLHSFNNAIEHEHIQEKYALEYKEGYFDVLELESNHWLYNTDSNKHANLVAKSIDFKKSGNLYETFNDVRISDEYAKELEAMPITNNSYSGAASLINYSNKYASKEMTSMKKIFKFIFLGVGLGLHIMTVHEKIKSNVYFIIEDDLELFRLSLFCTNYSKIAKDGAQLIFAIFEDDDNFKYNTRVFLETQFMYNHYIKYFHLLSHSDQKLKSIQEVIVSQTYLTFNYSALTTSLIRPLEHLRNGYKVLNIGDSFTSNIFTTHPVLLLGAGPSFQNNISWLQKNHKKFIIVAVTPLLAKLEELNIRPDIITHVHGFSDARPHANNVKDLSFFDKTISLFGAFSEPIFVDYFKKDNVYIFEGSSRYKQWNVGVTSSNIGSLSYALLMMLGTKNLYLLGLDFATDQTTGQTHSNAHNYNRNIELKEDEEIGGELILNQAVIKTKGNLTDKVFTTLLMNSWKDECNSLTHIYKTVHHNVFNLSSGAYIEDALPLKFEDKRLLSYKNIDKEMLHNTLTAALNNNSETFLTIKESNNLKLRIEYCDNIIDILNKHTKINHQNINQYHYNLLGAFYEILTDERDVKSSDVDYIITLYLQFVSGYIFDIINTQEIKDENKLIKHLDKRVIPQILRIIVFFKESIEQNLNFFKKRSLETKI